jgi:hypothetical protein
MSLTVYPLLTFLDATDHVLDAVLGGDASPRSRRMAVRAVQEAYSELPMRRAWRYYIRSHTIATVANQTTGSITYDYTGGASERMVTLASTTWPSDVTKYAIYISGARYSIDTRVSSTIITLRDGDCPTADIASGTAYNLVRDSYELPSNMRELYYLFDVNAPGRLLPREEPGDIIREQRCMRAASQPLMYGVYRNERYASSLAVHFAPSPSSARTYQGHALFWPNPLTVLDEKLGSASVTSGSPTVTGVGTNFTSKLLGAVIRISPTGVLKLPTDLQGEIDQNRLEPYALQGVVKSVESTTSLTMEQDADQTLATSGYRISSRIDIEPGAMKTAFLRCCEARFQTQDRRGADDREARYEKAMVLAMIAEKAMVLAMIADQRVRDSGGSSNSMDTLADIAASTNLTTGGVQP